MKASNSDSSVTSSEPRWSVSNSRTAWAPTMLRVGNSTPTTADRKSTRLNSSHLGTSYAVFCLKKKKKRNGGYLDCIQMDTSVKAAKWTICVGADIAVDADRKFFACLVRYVSSSVPTSFPTEYE